MNQLEQVFNYGDYEIRTVMINNEPWFMAKDVCDVLGLTNSRKTLSRLDDDEKNTVTLSDDNRGNPNKSLVNEYGVYNLVLASRKPQAQAFKRWITHEVIPSIRKHGAYMTDDVLEKAVSDPDFMIGILTKLKEEKQARLEAEAAKAIAERQLEIAKPKVEAYNTFIDSEGAFTLTETARLLKIFCSDVY